VFGDAVLVVVSLRAGEDMELSIRMVREKDAESIIELLNPIIQAGKYTAMDELFSVDDQIDFIRGFPKRGVYNVAVCNDSQKVLGIQDVVLCQLSFDG
jgi:L-amino acid N-acyltransferase YncA